ncbi:MAG: tRNA (adenosine(37)-N6)-threonylcarbamoyltransferase complex ATPase subunit type 1 TsaE [Fibrobacteraceae bacterium]|nr:tRNA (adenosine(37)-N6)-threonylcarbamoyltransferase complex ATPase subunit type 1 TsaE [Fibrobacteraceae bacterium]
MVFCSEEDTFAWAEAFAKTLKKGHMIALYGNLGAGKTVISRAICKGLGFEGSVCSPTYTILHQYPNNPPIYHFDLYRLEGMIDISEVGLDVELLKDGISLIEWPERLEENDPGFTHIIKIEILSETERKISLTVKGDS